MAGEPEGMVVSKISDKIFGMESFLDMLESDETIVLCDCLVLAVWPLLSLPLLWIPVLLLSDNWQRKTSSTGMWEPVGSTNCIITTWALWNLMTLYRVCEHLVSVCYIAMPTTHAHVLAWY